MDRQQETLNKILAQYDIKITKPSIYIEALTHNSYSNEHNKNYNYQKLEFLGDSIVNWIVSEFLYNEKMSEGEMSNNRSRIVRSETMAKANKYLGLEAALYLGHGVEKEISQKILEDTFEAFIGAVTLDAGIEATKKIIYGTIIHFFNNHELDHMINYKTLFQEAVQQTSQRDINYRQVECYDGSKKVELWYNKMKYGEGEGKKYTDAEQQAARNALAKLG